MTIKTFNIKMGKQRKNYWKCSEKHYPSTGRKYTRTEFFNNTDINSSADESRVQNRGIVKKFQSGSCSFAKEHEMNGKMHKHICSFCLYQGRFLGHAEKDCIFSKRNNKKNE